jgi:tetratricopeptide (TPR) repeat protein
VRINDPEVDAKIADAISLVELGYWQSDFAQHENCKKLLGLCQEYRHPMLGYAYLLYGRTFMIVGNLDYSREMLEKGVAWCRKRQDVKHLQLGLLWLGLALNKAGNFPRAFKVWQKCLTLALEQSDLEVAIEVYLNLGVLYQKAGWLAECSVIMSSCFSMSEAINNKKLLAKSGIFLSELMIGSGDYQSALSVISRSELDVILYSDVTWIVQLCRNKAECYWKTGLLDAATENYQSGLILAKKFEMAWGFIYVSVSYAQFLIYCEKYDEAEAVLEQVHPYFKLFPDEEQYVAWLKVQYQCKKHQSNHRMALEYLKQYKQRVLVVRDDRDPDGLSFTFRRMIKNKFQQLQREFRKCERAIDLPGVRMSMRQLLRFKHSCEESLDSGRIIEVIVSPPDKKPVMQRTAMVISDFCAKKDNWLNLSNGHYYIFPATNKKSLHDFSLALCRAIEMQPWEKINIAEVKVRSRILSADSKILEQVDRLIQQGWQHA